MKFIFSFFLYIVLMSPVLADTQCGSITNPDTCGATAGCYYDNDGIECSGCNELYYNPGGESNGTCRECGSYTNGVWSWAETESTHPDHSVFNPDYNNTTGLSSCPWVCATDYFQNDENSCAPCPGTSFSIITVDNGYMSNLAACCSGDNYLIKDDRDQYKCGQCGQNQAKTPVTGTSNVYTCTQCHEYAVVLDNECVCKGNTYGDGTTTCTKCPAGMLTVVPRNGETPEAAYERVRHDPNFQGEPGAREERQCKIGAFTKFCNGNGTNCMRLMQ